MESYKHKLAKKVLMDWLKSDFVRITPEEKFFMNGELSFITDLTCYSEDGINTIYEILNKHELDNEKLNKMQQYFYYNDIQVNVFEIQADWILDKQEKPNYLYTIDFTTKI